MRDYTWAAARRKQLTLELAALNLEFPHAGRPKLIDTFLAAVKQAGPAGISFDDLGQKGIDREAIKRFIHRGGLKEKSVFVLSRGLHGGIAYASGEWRDAAATANAADRAKRKNASGYARQKARDLAEYAQEVERKARAPIKPAAGPVAQGVRSSGRVDPNECRPWAIAACGGAR